jgi:hypothetical protein
MKMRLLIILLLFTKISFGQTELFKYPLYDSIGLDKYSNRVRQKDLYKDGNIVLSVGYKIDEYGTLQTPFWAGPAKEDSCMLFIENGKYSIYYFGADYYYQETFSDRSNIFSYSKKTLPEQNLLEQGQYYIYYGYSAEKYHRPKYKIGVWEKYDGASGTTLTDYGRLTTNNLPIKFEDKYSIISKLKVKTDSLIDKYYGVKFSRKYIGFNLDKSAYGLSLTYMRPDQPSGITLLKKSTYDIEYVDLCYDIVLNDTLRFDLIMIRLDKYGNIISERQFSNYANPNFNLCVGLTDVGKSRFHRNVYKFNHIARTNGFNPRDKDFAYRMEWNHTTGVVGKIKFVMEEPYETIEDEVSKKTRFRQLYIDPWTGKKLLKEKDGRIEEVIVERGH